MYTFNFLCALALFSVLQVPGTSAWFFGWFDPDEETETSGGATASSSEQTEIVDKHNSLRRGVQPTASNMLKMSWSSESADNAQKWANACTLKHSSDASREISSSGCGENLFMSSQETAWSDVIQAWYDEVKDFRYGTGSINGKMVGHYTQVVWYRSNLVGCGMAYCPGADYEYYYVCNYCPPGNSQFARPYKAGPTCGDCPNACEGGLCTNSCPYVDEISNCAENVAQWGCSHPKVASWCPATCKCAGSII